MTTPGPGSSPDTRTPFPKAHPPLLPRGESCQENPESLQSQSPGWAGAEQTPALLLHLTTEPQEGFQSSALWGGSRLLTPPSPAPAQQIRLFEFSEKAAAQEFISDHINCVSED